MYGQYQNQVSSAPKWIFFGLFGIILMGFLLGTNVKDATWLNSGIAAAQAEKTRMETAHQNEMNKLEERRTAAKTEAEIRQIQRDQEKLDAQHKHDLQVLDQDIANRQRWADFWINTATFLGIGAGIVAAISILTLVIVTAIAILRTAPKTTPVTAMPRALPEMMVIQPLPERQPYEPLESPQVSSEALKQLYDRRLAERQQELRQKQNEADVLIARMKAVIDPAQMSREKYNRQPLAGD